MDTVVTMSYDEYCKAAGDAMGVLLAVGGIALVGWGVQKCAKAAGKAINRYKINKHNKQIQREQAQKEREEADKKEFQAAVRAYKKGDIQPITIWVNKHIAAGDTQVVLGVN